MVQGRSIDVFSLAETDTRLRRVSHSEYAGPCPGCGGDDRFRVRLRGDRWRWMCRGCWDATVKGWGDEIEYLRQFRGMRFTEARASVQGNGEIEQARERVGRVLNSISRYEPPDSKWQDEKHESVEAATARVWTPAGAQGLAYWRSRGTTDETIRKAKLGYAHIMHPKLRRKVPCVVIPWYDHAILWRVQFRCILPGIAHDERYFMLAGSSNGGLYLGDSLTLNRPVVMTEGEIDALILAQECKGLISVIATGSTKGARTPKALTRLARCSRILVAFDNDDQGEDNANHWLERLDNAIRYRPLAHDVNAMLLEGMDVCGWVLAALSDREDVSTQEPDQAGPGTDTCADCGTPIEDESRTFFYWAISADEGICYCTTCRDEGTGLPRESVVPAEEFSVDAGTRRIIEAWPGNYTLEILPAGSLPPPREYSPVTLPPLDRATCPFRETVATTTNQRANNRPVYAMQGKVCAARATYNGWCETHQYSHTLLELGAKLNYARVELGETPRIIGAGVESWEAYAEAASRDYLKKDLPYLKHLVEKSQAVAIGKDEI